MSQQRLQYLLKQYYHRQCTAEETNELISTLETQSEQDLQQQFTQFMLHNTTIANNHEPAHLQSLINQITNIDKVPDPAISYKTHAHRHTYRWIAAAAILILAIGSGIYYFNHQSYKSQKSNKSPFRQETQASIPPGSKRAILTLSNGTQKELSPADNGLQLQPDALLLTTPNGGQYQAVLPDGSKVWLNAASSIKFPSKFTGEERRVEVTGEVYFEIAKDATSPFKVSAKEQEIEVLGTSFNINVYDDEPTKKTTLITGSIKISNNNKTTILQPGQAYEAGKLITTNIGQDIAWKNGYFWFNNTAIDKALRAVARWYGIEVLYPFGIPDKTITGEMGRDLNLNQLLELLKEIGLHYEIKNNQLIVLRSD